jgi:hypothetical protein
VFERGIGKVEINSLKHGFLYCEEIVHILGAAGFVGNTAVELLVCGIVVWSTFKKSLEEGNFAYFTDLCPFWGRVVLLSTFF